MAVGTNDIKLVYTGGANNSDPYQSLGGAFSSVVITDDPTLPMESLLEKLFPSVIGEEQASGKTRYRCIGVKNTHATDTAYRVRLKLSKAQGDCQIYFGWDPAAPGTAPQSIPNETTPPTGVTFSQPGPGNPLFMPDNPPDLQAGKAKALWIKFVVPPGAQSQTFEHYDQYTEWDSLP